MRLSACCSRGDIESHCPIELVQAKLLGPWDAVVLLPHLGTPDAARGKEPVQQGQIHRPFQIKPVFAPVGQAPHDCGQPRLLPQPPENQVRSDLGDRHRLGLSGGVRVEHLDFAGEAQPAAQQAAYLTAFPQHIQTSQRGDDSWRTVLPRRTLRAICRKR